MNIPESLINYACYVDGSNELVGMVDVTLPDVEYMSETLEGAGIAGGIDSITPGHTNPMNITINFRTLMQKNLSLIAPKSYAFEFRGAMKETNKSTREIETVPVAVAVRAFPKKTALGKLQVAKAMDTNNEFTVDYIKVDIKGRTTLEIDKINMIFAVDGKDYLADVRAALGK